MKIYYILLAIFTVIFTITMFWFIYHIDKKARTEKLVELETNYQITERKHQNIYDDGEWFLLNQLILGKLFV